MRLLRDGTPAGWRSDDPIAWSMATAILLVVAASIIITIWDGM